MTVLLIWGVLPLGTVACVALLVHALLPRRAQAPRPVSPSRSSLLVRCTVEWLGVWLWLSLVIVSSGQTLKLEGDHWLYRFAWVFGTIIASLTVAGTASRLRNRTATVRFARVHLWTPVALLAALAVGWVINFVQPIAATTAEAAAQKGLARMAPYIDEPVHLIETAVDHPLDFVDPDRCKAFWIMGVSEPRGRLTVCEYRRFWWRSASSMRFPPSRQELDRARKWLEEGRSSDNVTAILKRVVQNYPGTPAADEARELLRSLAD